MSDNEISYANRGTSNANTRGSLNGSFATNRWNDQDERENNISRQPQRGRGCGRGGYHGTRQQDGNRGASYGIGYQKIEELCNDMDQEKILPGSAELLKAVRARSFYNRLDDLWSDVEKQSNFLRVIVATASPDHENFNNRTHDFVEKVLQSTLLEKLVEKHIYRLAFDKMMQQKPIYADIAHHTVKLMVLGFDLLPSKMDVHLSKVESVINSLTAVKDICLKEETKVQLESLKISWKDRREAKIAQQDTKETRKTAKQPFEGSPGEPPTDFRQLSIVPTPEDICQKSPPNLQKIELIGKYDSDEEYLNIYYRLLREDLIRPLRDGINAYRNSEENDLFVYHDVEIHDSTTQTPSGELILGAHIKVLKRLRWDKRLKYGSLVCLSPDNFQNVFLFATVHDRKELAKGKFDLKFEELSQINTNQKYKMVESPAFFEAYRPVMMALQAFKIGEPVPFSKYLVNVETDTVPPPYSVDQLFDFKSLIVREEACTEFYLHQLNELEPKDFGMDESQFDALIYALSTQLAIIQGPPGTGKTYMGLQIAKLLLDNWNIWNPNEKDRRPMLVVCYTNHALDQFLEGISQFVPNGIIRVGGRCKNEAIEKFNLHKIRRMNKTALGNEFYDLKSEIHDIQRVLKDHSKTLKEFETRFIDPQNLGYVLCDPEKKYFKPILYLKNTVSYTSSETLMSKWLTQTDQYTKIEITDIEIIRQLMAWGIPEIQSKNALADALHRNDDADDIEIATLFKNKQCEDISSTELISSAKRWPEMSDVDEVKEMGFTEKVAVELLLRSSVEEIREEHNRRILRKKILVVAPAIPAAATVEEELDELAFKDDDEENRIIDDVHILENLRFHNGYIANEINQAAADYKWYNEEIMKDCVEHITSACPMTVEEANQVKNVWELPLQQRWRLYQYWVEKYHEKAKEKIKKVEEEYLEKVKQLGEFQTLVDIDTLKTATVIGMTTTGAAKHQRTLRAIQPKIVMVEEAAEILEAGVLTSLTPECQHLILIGDHKQLRPNVAVYELAKDYNLDVSLFERLINNGYPYRILQNQHRMCTDISQVLMPLFYETLHDDPSVFDKEAVKGVTKNLMFINHSYPEITEKDFKSHKNEYEAEFAIRLAHYFVQQNYKQHQITILCPYLDQLLYVRRKAIARFGKEHTFVIQSVDNYQGEENDIVILSLVRSNNLKNKVGFVKNPNRVCVALSRARLGLYVICNMKFLAENSKLWAQISQRAAGVLSNELVVSCQMHQTEQTIKDYNDFEKKCPEGGCKIPCMLSQRLTGRLKCGHKCNKLCHAEDMDHQLQKCFKPCEQKCSNSEYQHPCPKDCWQPCGDCLVKIPKQLSCGHEKFDYCHLDPAKVQCDEACQLILPCKHQCKKTCGAECTQYCKEKVQRQLPGCGHIVLVECAKDLSSFKCKTKVSKKWPFCNHTAEIECYSDVTTSPCPHPCNTVLPECGHLCKGKCGKCRNGRLHIACSEKCNKIFLCEHQCETKCSKICPPCDKPCETVCGHSQCGNQPINGEQMKKTRQLLEHKRGSRTGRKCGEPCPPCMEECLNRCEHRECSNKCGEPCDVKPCKEPCMKLLPCNGASGYYVEDVQHRCIGVCGEDCPKICKICNPEEFAKIKEVFLGNEAEENARFVQLKDCGHVIEVTGLDQWIKSSLNQNDDENASTEIVQIKCPLCKTPIRRSKRYISILNERAIDIEKIKQKTRGLTAAEKKREQEAFQKEVKDFFRALCVTNFGISKEMNELRNKFLGANSNVMTKNWFSTSRNILRIIQTLARYLNAADLSIQGFGQMGKIKISDNMKNFEAKLGELKITNFWRYLCDERNSLLQKINPSEISEFMLQQLSFEVQRFGFITDLFSYFSEAISCNVDFTPVEIQMITTIFEDLNGSNEFDDGFAKVISQKLEKLSKLHPVSNFGISKKERIVIMQALSSHITRWYKCPNGHHYGIGGCGAAVMTAKCPECQADIGGGSHQLLRTNQDAQNEMFEGTGITAQPYPNPFEDPW